MDMPEEESGPPAWLLAAGFAVALLLVLVYLFASPSRFLTGVALVLTGGPMTLSTYFGRKLAVTVRFETTLVSVRVAEVPTTCPN